MKINWIIVLMLGDVEVGGDEHENEVLILGVRDKIKTLCNFAIRVWLVEGNFD